MNANEPKTLLSITQAADEVGISRSTAYKLLKSGEWKSVKIGRLRKVSRRWLNEWVRSKEVES